jgi:hypothetical protein
MKHLVKAFMTHLSPGTCDLIRGIGMAFDPVPRYYFKTFHGSDAEAFYADAEALYSDWCSVRDHRLPHQLAHHQEADHFWGFRPTRSHVAARTERQQRKFTA